MAAYSCLFIYLFVGKFSWNKFHVILNTIVTDVQVVLLEIKEEDKTVGEALHTISRGLHEKVSNSFLFHFNITCTLKNEWNMSHVT